MTPRLAGMIMCASSSWNRLSVMYISKNKHEVQCKINSLPLDDLHEHEHHGTLYEQQQPLLFG